MRRNMDIIRELLIKISEGIETLEYDPQNSTDKIYIYHIELLEQAGFLKYDRMFQDMVPMIYIDRPRLTWNGNDYLDSIANESVWNKTKDIIISKGLELGDVPISVIKELTKSQLKKIIGLD